MHLRSTAVLPALALTLLLAAPATWAKPDFVVNDTADTLFFAGCDVGTCTLREAFAAVSAGDGKSIGCDAETFPAGSGTAVELAGPLTVTVATGFALDCTGRSILITQEAVTIESGPGTSLSNVTVRSVSFEGNLQICGGTGGGPSCDQPLSKVTLTRVGAAQVDVRGSSVTQVAVTRSAFEDLRIFAQGDDLSGVTVLDNYLSGDLGIESTTGTAGKVKVLGNSLDEGDICVAGQGETRDVLIVENIVADGSVEVEGGDHSKLSILKNQITIEDDAASIGIEVDALGSIEKMRIENNAVTGGVSSSEGIYVVSSEDMSKIKVSNNRVTHRFGDGIEVNAGGSGNTVQITNNVCTDNGDSGIYVTLNGTKKNKIQSNVTNGNEVTGIDLNGTPFDVSKNRAFGNDDYGIDGWDATNSSFKKNEARGNPSGDLSEQNGCATNTWKGNTFHTSDDPCIQ